MQERGQSDKLLLRSFGMRRRVGEPAVEETALDPPLGRVVAESDGGLVEASQLEAFVEAAYEQFSRLRQNEILRRALAFVVSSGDGSTEASFINLYAALESTLTFFRREDEYEILPPEEFAKLERDLKRWLKEHPLLAGEAGKRALIYEKIRELNRFPFGHVFRKFCDHYQVDLSDLWPVLGGMKEWPLMEIRHRLVHGDPFVSRPEESLRCAREHLRFTVERMLLPVLGWPVSRSCVRAEYLSANVGAYRDWQAERARFA